jgi:hypothetical protein
VRDHRALVRHRCFLRRRTTSVKNKLRWILARYNADIPGLFTAAGQSHLQEVALRTCFEIDRFDKKRYGSFLVDSRRKEPQRWKAGRSIPAT